MRNKLIEFFSGVYSYIESKINLLPDIIILFANIILAYITFNNFKKIIPILFVCNSLFYLFKIIKGSQKNIKAINEQKKDELNTIWFSTNIKVIEFILATYLIINIARYLIPSIFHIGSVDAWIGFSGSIISGIITMMALLYTINHEATIREEDKKTRLNEIALQSIPILKICPSVKSAINSFDFEFDLDNYQDAIKNNEAVIALEISNESPYISRNLKFVEAKIFKCSTLFFDFFDILDKRLIKAFAPSANKQLKNVRTIPGQYSTVLLFNFPYTPTKNEGVLLNLSLEYFDYTLTIKHLINCQIYLEFKTIFLKDKKNNRVTLRAEIVKTDYENNFIY